ncbi:hypothetical protein GRI39_10530 [Altererythrobacter indicus]|uniref:Uncharacterized protein n=1 Tax=Altericroceibacterium indicum TaxID=374177 RepID=A0A845A9V9_9SPHN|nr:DUF6489 family protein [Altericroceibacterium indicum]MXP26474.1 hypothetical protein [Altericroceibacterium indicum]
MKVNIEIECTPQEARSFMGLPDVERANEAYLEQMSKAMKGVSNVDQLQEYAKQLAPMGQMGVKFFQSLMENSASFNDGAKKSRPSDDKTKP